MQHSTGLSRSTGKKSTTAISPEFENLLPFPVPPKRLLVVDDEPAIRELFGAFLATEGFKVDLAANASDAWRMVQTKTYDCILLDLGMPEMGGEELYALIEGFDKQLSSRVIFVTGGAVTPAARALILAPGNPVLSKPFQLDELRQQIFKLLQAPG